MLCIFMMQSNKWNSLRISTTLIGFEYFLMKKDRVKFNKLIQHLILMSTCDDI